MRGWFDKVVGKALKAKGLTKEEFAFKVLPSFLIDIITQYLRVECSGLENIPKRGPYIIIANHSGFMGFDAVILNHQVFLHTRRVPRIIAHKMWFLRPEIAVPARRMGLVPATMDNGLGILEKKQPLLLFPEGEEGNFKPSRYRYRLRRFRRGFVRLGLRTGVPIIPCSVIGAEETHINLSQIRWAKNLLGIILPVPLNVIPLPAKWHIHFGKPIFFEKDPARAEDMPYVTKLSRQARTNLQRDLHQHLKERKRIFLPEPLPVPVKARSKAKPKTKTKGRSWPRPKTASSAYKVRLPGPGRGPRSRTGSALR